MSVLQQTFRLNKGKPAVKLGRKASGPSLRQDRGIAQQNVSCGTSLPGLPVTFRRHEQVLTSKENRMCLPRKNVCKNVWGKSFKVSHLSLLKKITFGAVTVCLAISAHAAQIQLAWDPPTNANGTPITTLAGYKLYYGPGSRTYPAIVTVGNHTTFTLDGLEAGTTYYFAVTAYDQTGVESEYSEELQVTIEVPASPQPSEPPPTSPPTPTSPSIVSVWLEAEEGDIQAAAEPITLPNLISNSDIESSMWTSGAFANTKPSTVWATDTYHSGIRALQMTSGTYFYGYWNSAFFPVTPGKNYATSMWVKTAAVTQGVSLNVTWYDASNRSLPWTPAVGGKVTSTQAWRPIQGIVTAPTNAARAVIHIRVESTGGSAWVDDVVCQAEGASPPAIEVAVDDSASAGAYVWVASNNADVLDPAQPGEMVEYDLAVTTAGIYTIWGRVRPGEDGLGSFFVNVSPATRTEAPTYYLWDVATLTTASNTTTAATTWGWRRVNDLGVADPVHFSFAPGEYTLTLKPREAGTKIDRLLITNDLQYVPQGRGTLN